MLFFLQRFATSFPFLVVAWPILAALLALPVLVRQTGRHDRPHWTRSITLYLFVFYVLGLVMFTLLPLPDDFAAYCARHDRPVQLVPFRTILNALDLDAGNVAQVALNIVVFIPLGIFARVLLGLPGRQALLLGLALSLIIEATQATGLWGAAPCRHRVADVDDLILNALGTWLGVLIARLPAVSSLRNR